MCGGVVAYVGGREGGPCEVQMEKRWVAGQWGEVHGNIHEMYCGVSWST
jgi:hypothetical protein